LLIPVSAALKILISRPQATSTPIQYSTCSVTQTQSKPSPSATPETSPQLLPPLEPLPIQFLPFQHKYLWTPTGQPMAFSITSVVNTKTPAQMEQINRTKDGPMGWAYTGTMLHSYAESFLTTGDPGPLEPWANEYILPMVNDPIWAHFSVLATEYRVCDLTHSIGGSFDALLQSKRSGRTLLLDFKSQRSAKAAPYDISAQLGGYVHLLQQHHDITIDGLAAAWLRPGAFDLQILKTTVQEALTGFLGARDAFLAANVPW
jgi:hypothetical protein